MSRENGNCTYQSIFLEAFLMIECSNRLMCKHNTKGSLRIKSCFTESCLSWRFWQWSLWSSPSFSGLVNKSRHPMRVEVEMTDQLPFNLLALLRESAERELLASKRREISIQGSYIVEVNPQPYKWHLISITRRKPNELCTGNLYHLQREFNFQVNRK